MSLPGLFKIRSHYRPKASTDSFVGDIGELFYDFNNRQLRISDGLTPGGISIAGGGAGGVTNYNDLTNKPDLTIYQLSATAFSGSYNDLSNKPSIPTNTNELTNDAGFITAGALSGLATETYVTTRGYITDVPEASSNVKGGIKLGRGLTKDANGVVDAFSGSYNDLTDKPTIPTDINQLSDASGLLSGGGSGLGISNVAVNESGRLIITYTDNTTVDAGYVVGPQGEQGIQGIQGETGATGADGVSAGLRFIYNSGPGFQDPGDGKFSVNRNSVGTFSPTTELIFSYQTADTIAVNTLISRWDDNTTQTNRGVVMISKADGTQQSWWYITGAYAVAGTGLWNHTPATFLGGNTAFTNGEEYFVTFVPNGDKGDTGATGADGADGVGVSNATVDELGNLIITLDDTSTIDAGHVVGPQGETGATGPQGPAGQDSSARYQFRYSTTTSQADPGPGYFRLNNSDMSAATQLYLDIIDYDPNAYPGGNDLSTFLSRLTDYGSVTNRGFIKIEKANDSTWYQQYVFSTVTNSTGYYTITIDNTIEDAEFTNDDICYISFILAGPQGPAGVTDYNNLTNKPTLVTSYTQLTDLPTLFSGSYTDLTNKPTDFKGSVFGDDSTLLVDAINSTIPYSVLSGVPVLSAIATSGLSVAEINENNQDIINFSSITALKFDTDSGFAVTDLGNGAVKIAMNSTFKTWHVEGEENLVAEGLDDVEFVAGNGIILQTDALASPYKQLIITTPPKTVQLFQDGTLQVINGTVRWHNPADLTISKIIFRLATAADNTVSVRIKKTGQTFSTTNISANTTKVVVEGISLSMTTDDYLTVDVTAVGDTAKGSGLSVEFFYTLT